MPTSKEARTKMVMAILCAALGALVAGCGPLPEFGGGAAVTVPAQGLVHAQAVTTQSRDDGADSTTTDDHSAGAELYALNCAICHGADGDGGVGPALADNPNLRVTDYVVAQVLLGGGGMPPFAPRFSDEEVAAVVTFVSTSWGNQGSEVKAEQVQNQRLGLRPGLRLGARPPTETGADASGGLSMGERIYVRQGCSGCHGVDGEGGSGPALAGNQRLEDASSVIQQILHGGDGMPPFANQLSDEEIAAVATHERTSWGNDFGPVDAQQVAESRQAQEAEQ